VAHYDIPWKAIYYDLDGTLTGKGPNSWATPFYPSHNWTNCEYTTYAGGFVCDSTTQIRRIAFHSYKPSGLFTGMALRVLRWDDDMFLENGGSINKTTYLLDRSNYGRFVFKMYQDPKGWAIPIVTGHKYKIHWGEAGIDFEEM